MQNYKSQNLEGHKPHPQYLHSYNVQSGNPFFHQSPHISTVNCHRMVQLQAVAAAVERTTPLPVILKELAIKTQ